MMNEKETVKKFLEHGFQITNDTIPLVSKNTDIIIKKLENLKPRPFIVTKKHVEPILSNNKKKIEHKPVKINDFIQYLQSKYEDFRKVILEKNKLENLLSINKISEQSDNFSLIVLVRKINKDSLLVEDLTGEVNIFFNEDISKKINNISLDDVIGIKCEQKNSKIKIKDIINLGLHIDTKSFLNK